MRCRSVAFRDRAGVEVVCEAVFPVAAYAGFAAAWDALGILREVLDDDPADGSSDTS